jgi:hypothetical protein
MTILTIVTLVVLIMALVSLRLLKLKLKLVEQRYSDIEEKIKKPCLINCTKCRAYNRCVLNYGSDMCLIKQEPRDYDAKF